MLIPINQNIFFIEAPNKARFPYCHGLYIKDELRVVIDTGCSIEDATHLNEPGLDVVINSHFHEDHILHNYMFKDAKVWVHGADAPAVKSLDTFLDYYGFNEYNALKVGQDFIDSINLKPSRVDRELEANEILDFGKVKLHVIHTPGHTPGHCCFYEEKTGLLFLGDIDLSSFGPWYGHACSDIEDFINSINKCLHINPAIAISCHKGLFTTDIKEYLVKYLDSIYTKQDLVLNALVTPHTLEQLTDKQLFYGTRIVLDPLFRLMEKMAIFQHLKRLINLGLVKYSANYYYLV